MIHDGFIYLGTLMLLAAILVNLPVYLKGKGAQKFFKFASAYCVALLRYDAFMYYENVELGRYCCNL